MNHLALNEFSIESRKAWLRTVISMAAVLFVASTISARSQLERVEPEVEVSSVTVDELVQAAEEEQPPQLIDVRLKEDFEADPVLIPKASWQNPHDIDAWAKDLSPDVPVVVYCVAGRWVSQSVTKKLEDMGFTVSQLTGGIEAWQAAGKKTKPVQRP